MLLLISSVFGTPGVAEWPVRGGDTNQIIATLGRDKKTNNDLEDLSSGPSANDRQG